MGTTLPGKQFLVRCCCLIVLIFAQSRRAQGQGVALPEPPVAAPPVIIDEKLFQEDLERKRNHRKDRSDKKDEAEEGDRYKRLQEKKFREEVHAGRPFRALFELSLVYPVIKVSGTRRDYRGEPTSHFNAIFRVSDIDPKKGGATFAGLRLAPFVGTGKQGGSRGRFGFLYFGPSLGFGRFFGDFDPASVRYGGLFSTGISLLSRTSSDKGGVLVAENEQGEDFKAGPMLFDSPGLWMEGRMMVLHFNAVSYGPIIGVQTGSQKYFAYFGVQVAGWH